MSTQRPIAERLAVPALLLAGLLLHLPWTFAPFGFFEMNAGYFFGPFAQSWQRFGWLAVRGAPIGAFEGIALQPADGFPYFNHPPGFAWLCWLCGTAEWQLRLPTIVAGIAVGPLVWALARRRGQDALAAFVAALLAMAVPAVAFAPQVSYECTVLAAGLLVLWLHERAGDGRRGAGAGAIAVAAVGAWLDWQFGFYVCALFCGARGRFGARLRAVAATWGFWALSVGTVLLWVAWAKAQPFAQRSLPGQESFGGVVHRAVFDFSAPWGELLAGIGARLADGYTVVVLAAAAVGVLLLVRRAAGSTAALLAPGLLVLAVFRTHATDHLMFVTHLGGALAIAVGELLATLRRWRVPVAAVALLGAALLVPPLWQTIDFKVGATQPVFAVLGRTLSTLAGEPKPAGDPRPVLIGTNADQYYPYYITASGVYMFPVVDPGRLAPLVTGPTRIRFLYVDAETRQGHRDGPRAPRKHPELFAWLETHPKRALPELVGDWHMRDDIRLFVHEAAVYDL